MGHSQSTSSSSSTPNSRSRSSTITNSTNKPIIDLGYLEPQSHIYASSFQEYNIKVVIKLILDRRLSPFYLGLNDYESDWELQRLIEALEEAELQSSENVEEALKSAMATVQEANETNLLAASTTTTPSAKKSKESLAIAQMNILHRDRLMELQKTRERLGGGGFKVSNNKEEVAKLYIGRAIECPICFLYYPPPLVNTRCCDQPICTECFVQIKRSDPTPTHLESEPAACPFCCESNFGVVYNKESGRPSLATLAQASSSSPSSSSSTVAATSTSTVVAKPPLKTRRRSFAHTEKEVVTTDHIHPDWEIKLEAVKATAARRANRRIVFRQVGDRLVPVGVTSNRSGDGSNTTMSTGALPAGFAAQVAAAFDSSNAAGAIGGREGRRAARKRNAEMTQYLESIGMGVGPDLEEMMVLEALRLSMVDDEERQKNINAATGAGGVKEGAVAETSAQGAARRSSNSSTSAGIDGVTTTTANLLADAIGNPMTSNRIQQQSSSRNSNPLPPLPPTTNTTTTSLPESIPPSIRSNTSTSTSSSSSSTPFPTYLQNTSSTPVESSPLAQSIIPPTSSSSLHSLPIAASTREVLEEDSTDENSLFDSRKGYENLPSPP